MTSTFVPLRRISALSVAITLFAAPIASAQSPEAAPPNSAQARALLSPAAFGRLVQPTPTVARTRIVQDPPRIDLRRSGIEAAARRGSAAFAMAPQQRSWAARHKWAFIVPAIVVGAIFGTLGLMFAFIPE
jgi:hypothetical protein